MNVRGGRVETFWSCSFLAEPERGVVAGCNSLMTLRLLAAETGVISAEIHKRLLVKLSK